MKSAATSLVRLTCAAFCAGSATLLAQFAPDDEVRLRRDEPLHFKDAVFRHGKTGEVFKVMKYDPATGQVFLLANGSDGKPFALRCADGALEPAPKDAWSLIREGLNAMQMGELEYARTRFVRASTGTAVDDSAVKLALHCESLRKAALELVAARETQVKALAEVARLTRNAQVADRPSLTPGDTSNQRRAEEIRRQAQAMRERAEKGVTNAIDALVKLVDLARAHAKSLIKSGSLSIGLALWDAVNSFARKHLPPDPQTPDSEFSGRAEIMRRINAASDALARAHVNFDAKKLLGALGALENGLQSEPGRGDLKQFRTVVESAVERARARVQTARSLADQERRDEALAELAKAEAICADDMEAAALGRELRPASPK